MSEPLLSTSRLRFDNWRPDDAESLFTLHSSPHVQQGYPFPPTAWTQDAISKRLLRYIEEQEHHGLTKWKVSLLDGTFVGRAGWSPWEDQIEIGYAVLPQFQGMGIATEAAFALLKWGRTQRSEPLVGFAMVGNRRSRRILERIGMTHEDDRVISNAAHAFYRFIPE